jgi:hypothetical protein
MAAAPDPAAAPRRADGVADRLPPHTEAHLEGMAAASPFDDATEKRLDEIEMIGEEHAANLPAPGHSEVTAGMRYLHASRTIHQLVTDRNRAVGIYLAVASLLYTASAALLNAQPAANGVLIVPLEELKRWCLPLTFATLAVLAIFVGLLLVRTRVGLIYEVAKMNVLLGIPSGRVQRINPLSIFFLMHLLVSAGGGLSAALFSQQILRLFGVEHEMVWAVLIGVAAALLLVALYLGMVWYTTTDEKLNPPTAKGPTA